MIALEQSAFCPNLLQIIYVYHVAGATAGLITTVRPRWSGEHEDSPVDIDDSPSIQHLIDRLPTSEAARSELLSHASPAPWSA